MKFPEPIVEKAENLKDSFDSVFSEDNSGHDIYSAQCAIVHIDELLKGKWKTSANELNEYENMKEYLIRMYITNEPVKIV